MATNKPAIIEYIFRKLWDPATGKLNQTVVTMAEVQEAIRALPNLKASDRNPANFFKDFIRSKHRNAHFPPFILQSGYTARQAIGKGPGACFEFVPLASGVNTAFGALAPSAQLLAKPHPVESVSMPLAARLLGRGDESWLAQVVARLNILATHFALKRGSNTVQFDLLQIAVKLGKAEVDALFLMTVDDGSIQRKIFVPAEMKGRRDEIEVEQIARATNAVLAMVKAGECTVIPVAVKVVGHSLLYIVEFQECNRNVDDANPLAVASEAVYLICPAVPGIE